MKTRVTEQLGIRYPIIQGGMQWVGTADIPTCAELITTHRGRVSHQPADRPGEGGLLTSDARRRSGIEMSS